MGSSRIKSAPSIAATPVSTNGALYTQPVEWWNLDNVRIGGARVQDRDEGAAIGVHGEIVLEPQQTATIDMVYGVATLIEYISGLMTLEPGDVIFTGIGGQGVQLCSKVLANAAVAAGHHVMLSSYFGGEMRGDSAKRDADGYFWIIGRTDDRKPTTQAAAIRSSL